MSENFNEDFASAFKFESGKKELWSQHIEQTNELHMMLQSYLNNVKGQQQENMAPGNAVPSQDLDFSLKDAWESNFGKPTKQGKRRIKVEKTALGVMTKDFNTAKQSQDMPKQIMVSKSITPVSEKTEDMDVRKALEQPIQGENSELSRVTKSIAIMLEEINFRGRNINDLTRESQTIGSIEEKTALTKKN